MALKFSDGKQVDLGSYLRLVPDSPYMISV